MSYGNGIKLTAGFDVGAKTPLDSKSVVQTIAERDAFVTDNLAYEGLEVYVKDTRHKYRYEETGWIDLDTQSGSESGTGEGLTTEQANQLTTAYEHSQSEHVQASDIPAKVSDLTNDSGFITSDDLPTIPTKVSEFENDSNFVTNSEMTEAIANASTGSGSSTSSEYIKTKTIVGEGTNAQYNYRIDMGNSSDKGTKFYDYDGNYKFYRNYLSELKNTATELFSISKDKISTSVDLYENGSRVYSPNNKPTATDLGISVFSGKYADLSGTPTIPSKTSDLTNDSSFVTTSEMNSAIADIATGGTIDLSGYQPTSDSSLKTTDKTIVGAINELVPKNLYTFTDAYTQWCKGEKFPIAFYGDSTIDGNTTTGFKANTLGADSTSTNTFCNVLQALLREECNNSTLRIYNAGFSGKTIPWGVTNFDAEFGEGTAYSDVKMIGIGFGINERLSAGNLDAYRENIRTNTETLINKCYEKGIQPFLLTTQATSECGVQSDYTSSFPLRDSFSINVSANEVKRELAEKYNIPLIDINKYTELFLAYSKEAVNIITTDRLHFSDVGHKFEAGVIFAHIVPRTIWVENEDEALVTYESQQLRSAIPEEKLSYGGKLKVYANYTQSSATDTKIMDTYVFIKDRPAKISAFKEGLVNATHIKIDGVDYDSPLDITDFGEVDLGLHHLEAYTGANTTVNFSGFGVNDNEVRDMLSNGLNYENSMGFFGTDSSVFPSVLWTDYDKTNKSTLYSGKTITKIILPINGAGKLTIGKVDITKAYTGVAPTIIDPVQYDVVVGDNTIELNVTLGEHETLSVGNSNGDTALPKFAMCSNASVLPNYYKYTRILLPPQYKDINEVSAVVLCCAIYGKESENAVSGNYLTAIPDEYITETELNAKGYLTEHQDISNLALKSEIPDVSSFITSDDLPTVPTKVSDLANDKNYISSIPSEYVTETELNAKGYLTSHQDISGLQPKTDNSLTTTDKTVTGAINELNNKQQLTENTLTSIEHQIEDALNCIDIENHALRLVIVSKDYETLVFRGKTYNCYDSIAVAIDTEYELITSAYQLGLAVIVMEGTYTECIRLNGKKNISIVGVNKYKCKIVNEETDTENGYQYPPLWINPSTTVMNLTIQCTTSRNIREAYCIHTDDDGTGKVLIKNCILHCSQHACIGFGTRQDAPLFIEDCDMINDYSNAKSVLLYGHNACVQNTTREEVHITRCYGRTAMGYPLDFFNANWYYPTGARGSLPWLLYFNDNTFYRRNEEIPTTITVSTEYTGESKDTINFISGGMMRMPSNSGNNIATLNYPYQNAIENVPPTSIAFNTDYVTKFDSGISMYEIRNGICYVTMDVTSVVSAEGGKVVCTLPKPSTQMQFTISPFSKQSTIHVGAILFTNGNLSFFSLEVGQRYMFSFSYPVAEP